MMFKAFVKARVLITTSRGIPNRLLDCLGPSREDTATHNELQKKQAMRRGTRVRQPAFSLSYLPRSTGNHWYALSICQWLSMALNGVFLSLPLLWVINTVMSSYGTFEDGIPRSSEDAVAVAEPEAGESSSIYRESDSRRQIGIVSAVFIIFNRIIGTGWVWHVYKGL